ncbi:MAG: glucokinase [Verrucomicrobia bacterium]|nr:glucokinase [Verrucomicrobiota bacterium]
MIIAGDVGGTNVRLAFFDKGKKRDPLFLEKYRSADFSDFSSLLRKFIETLNGKQVEAACFGVAGPVQNGRCQATNLPWVIDASELSKELGNKKVWLINDLEANAWGVTVLNAEELLVLNGGEKLQGNGALISAGTGLGEAGLYWNGKAHVPFACEGGHTDFAPTDEEQVDLWRYLKGKFEHVSYERVLSGSGIFQIYQFLIDTKKEKQSASLAGVENQKEPQRIITEMALKKECPACVRTIDLFCSIYGSEAGNLALKMLSTHSMYIGGGIAPKISGILKNGRFMKAFTAKGRFLNMLSKIPVQVILNDQTALLGAAQYAQEKK